MSEGICFSPRSRRITLEPDPAVDSFLVSAPHEHPHQAFNAADYFVDRHLREGRGDRIAIECENQRVSYSELSERVNRIGNALLEALQVRMEERVLLLLPDIPEFAYCFFGAIKIGAVPVPLNTLLRATEYEFLLNDTRARVAITTDSLLHLIRQIPRERLHFLQSIIVVGSAPRGTTSFSDLLVSHSADLTPAPTCADDVAFWLYSSGSTGSPKGCIHLHHDMVAATEQYARNILQIRESDRFFSAAKLFFAYGLGNALYFPLAVGATSILWPGPPSSQNICDVVARHRPTLFFSVPSIYAALLDFSSKNRIDPAFREGTTSVVPKTAARLGALAPEVTGPATPNISDTNSKDFDLSSIRLGVSAGEALPASLSERFSRRFGFAR